MRTDQLVKSLVADLHTPSGSVFKVIATGLFVSAILSLLITYFGLGLRPDLAIAIHGVPFWLKATYTFCIGTAGLAALERLGRPGVQATRYFALTLTLVIVFQLAAAAEISVMPAAERTRAWMGNTWYVCPALVLLGASPMLIAAFIALRQMAPTNYAAAACAAGLMAGWLRRLRLFFALRRTHPRLPCDMVHTRHRSCYCN